ncbi:MAG: hypothetical protein V4553_05750 [Bacteroidota bacterium]
MKRNRLNLLFFSFTGHYCRVPRHRRIRRTTIWLLMLTFFGTMSAQAQFLGGFFSQQSQKKKLMAEQIAGLQVYLGAIGGGYHIAQTGLNTAHELKNGTFSLHTAYFNSLAQVNPVVRNNSKGKLVTDLYSQLNRQFDQEQQWQKQQQQLTAVETANLVKVAANLKKLSDADMAELTDVLTPGKLQLTDEQRLARVDKLYAAMKDKAAFTASFTGKCRQLALARRRAKADQDQLRKLYGIQ